MKKVLLTIIVMTAVVVFLSSNAYSFHDAANLICKDCHTMHYSEGGAQPPSSDAGGPFAKLLLRKNKTDLCLNCHSDQTKAPDIYKPDTGIELPGGDIGNASPLSLVAGAATTKGHNPYGNVANPSANINADATLGLTPPGGAGALTEFTCVSCHSAHGGSEAFGAFRNVLKTVNGQDNSATDLASTLESNIWTSPGGPNIAQGAANHMVYKIVTLDDKTKGQGKWCASCHGNFHGVKADANMGSGADWVRHPTTKTFTAAIATNYGATTNSLENGYPIETNDALASIAAEWNIVAANDQVACLSCHKAHASGNANATRRDMTVASGAGTGCNKCHAKG